MLQHQDPGDKVILFDSRSLSSAISNLTARTTEYLYIRR